MFEKILILATAILLPIIPAYFLYKNLPSKILVKGPFQGLTVQLTGAFGGYFLVMLATFVFYHTLPDNSPKGLEEVWTIRGKLPSSVPNVHKDTLLSARPPSTQIDEDGTFTMRILAPNNQPELPTLVVQHPLYKTENIHFPPRADCSTLNVNRKDKTVDIPAPCLHLTKLSELPEANFTTLVEPVQEK